LSLSPSLPPLLLSPPPSVATFRSSVGGVDLSSPPSFPPPCIIPPSRAPLPFSACSFSPHLPALTHTLASTRSPPPPPSPPSHTHTLSPRHTTHTHTHTHTHQSTL